ncbi:uncharacterized protein ATNIH1004_006401 [Aspergillus tanneri]|uniref:Alpha-ketoglutarate-dependent dioxygenase AlkB-like domain-containing protein n=1 Tax=Aspergillus tanneri TaxID=1220188 RepID=A0A5M9MQP9_9EURO|nr:uncharacterized protein ATNIH1004_006401 [Aspergillus tanneri]KAA8647704.1 hypothetical protein ATNIH1004_006401 [Aspergillus tanneri]
MNLKVPVGLIIGDRNTILGRKLPHRYNVMAYFRITDIWYEKVGDKAGAKLRFEKLDLSSQSCFINYRTPPDPEMQPHYSLVPDLLSTLEKGNQDISFSRIAWKGIVRDLGLRRYPLQQSVVAGTLTAHFAVNYGMPYKYVVSVASKAFDEAPSEILRALGRLTWATERAVNETGDTFLPPNELLVLGYFEDMKIGVCSRSTMFIRMKNKYYHGFSKSKKLLDIDPVLQGCASQHQRHALKNDFESGKLSRAAYDKLRREMFKKSRSGEAPPAIKMELNHGDLVVMHGESLQKYYEHSVVPEKKLRFALTARYIKPEHVDANELQKGAFKLSSDQIYDGK